MKTERLYQHDVYARKCTATVIDIITEPKPALILDQTVFFPEGGGQPSDTGTIAGIPVTHVSEDGERILHEVEEDIQVLTALKGTKVKAEIFWEQRFRNMQRHCGEHILSASFYDLCGGVNRGFHWSEGYMMVDISLEEDENCREMTDELMAAVEWDANQYIWRNDPVTTVFCKNREEAEQYPMRKKLALEEDIFLVCVGDPQKPAGRVACCGTHPPFAGQVGLVKIYKWEHYKGMIRVTFDAGQDALRHCMEMEATSKFLCNRYSAEPAGLLEKIDAAERKNRGIRQELYELKRAVLEERAADVETACREAGAQDGKAPVMVFTYPLLKTDDLLNMIKLFPPKLKNLVLLVSEQENTVILFCQGKTDCGKLVKDNAGVWRGKGGGRSENARAMFPDPENMSCFLDFVKKAY